MILSNLAPLHKKRKRVGRGGSRGGTSGRGGKGQKARSGPCLGLVFEGGQMPMTRRIPKRGFTNAPFKKIYEIINLENLENNFESGDLINKESLVQKGILKNGDVRIKILGDGALKKKLIVHADAFSKSAAEAITNKGGEVHLTKEI